MSKRELYVGSLKEAPEIIPSINGVSLRHTKTIETADHAKRISGDIYYKDVCIGYYNPIYRDSTDHLPRRYIRVEKKYSEIKTFFDNYIAFDRYPNVDYNDDEEMTGFEELLIDIERLNWVSEFIINIINIERSKKNYYMPPEIELAQGLYNDELGDITGIINGDAIKVAILDCSWRMDKEQIINLINEKVESILLNKNYKTIILKEIKDFNIITPEYLLKNYNI